MTIEVRKATEDDVNAIVDMSAKFYATTAYAAVAPMSRATVEKLTRWLIETGVMLVAFDDSKGWVGMVGLGCVPGTFNDAMVGAHEIVWYVDPEARNGGVGRALLEAIEPACKERGADAIWMMHLADSPPQAGEMYVKMGFAPSEHSYMKRI